MKSGLYLGRWFGIDVIVHWTFLLLVGLLMATQLLTGASWAAVAGSTTLAGAIRTIVVADAVMSLDNVIAVAGAAKGSTKARTAEGRRDRTWQQEP